MPDYGGITGWLRSTDIFQLLHDKFDTVFEIRSKYRKMLLEHDVKSVPLFAIIVLRTTVGPKFHSPIIFVKKLISTHIQRLDTFIQIFATLDDNFVNPGSWTFER